MYSPPKGLFLTWNLKMLKQLKINKVGYCPGKNGTPCIT